MSELDLRNNPWGEGYPHDQQALWLELYYLSAIFGASKNISLFRSEGEGDYDILGIFRRIEYSEISKRLISIATISRNTVELWTKKGVFSNSEFCEVVGKLWENSVNKDKVHGLSFREACNKIVHANHINFDLTKIKDILSGHLNPIVYLYGVHNKFGWKCKIDIYKFVKVAFKLI
jgi:hypothetical protein